jgi:hypothetical protein
MPYKISGKGDGLGCKGYAVQDESGKTVGCHATRSEAENHMQALYANVPEAKKDMSLTVDPKYPGAGIKRPEQGRAGGTTRSSIRSSYAKKPKKNRKGRSPDANNGSAGAIGAGGTSMGSL